MRIYSMGSTNKLFFKRVVGYITIFLLILLCFQIFTPVRKIMVGNIIENSAVDLQKPNTIINQPFQTIHNGLSGIQILFHKQNSTPKEDTFLFWNLSQFTNERVIVASGMIPIQQIIDGKYYTINFEPIKKSSLKPFMLTLYTGDGDSGLMLASTSLAQSTRLQYSISNSTQTGTLVFNVISTNKNPSTLLLIISTLLAGIIWSIIRFQKPIRERLNVIPLEKSVPLIILLFGLGFALIEPPLHLFDEPENFRRIWEISTGTLRPTVKDGIVATYLPEYIQNTFNRIYRGVGGSSQNPLQLLEMLKEPPGDPTQLSTIIVQTSAYNFLAYIIPATFVMLGTKLRLSALSLVYLARTANLLQFVLLITWTLKNAKVGKYAIASFAMLGFMLPNVITINIDGLLYGGCLLFLASVTNLSFSSETTIQNSPSEVWGMVVGLICIVVSKYVYLPVILLLLLIPITKFGDIYKKFGFILLFWSVAVIFSIIIQFMMPMGIDPRIDYVNIDLQGQLKYLLHPVYKWLVIVMDTLLQRGSDYFRQLNYLHGTNESIGIIGWLQIPLLIYYAISDTNGFERKITILNYFLICLAIILGVLAFMLPLYLAWTPVGAPLINGIQGRYFLPQIAVSLIFFKPRFLRINSNNVLLIFPIILFLIYFMLYVAIFFY